MSSAICFNLDQSKILSSGNRINGCMTFPSLMFDIGTKNRLTQQPSYPLNSCQSVVIQKMCSCVTTHFVINLQNVISITKCVVIT